MLCRVWSDGGGDQGRGGVGGGVVEVDFFDEADSQLVVGEVDVLGGVDARGAVLAHPPEGQRAENGQGTVSRGAGPVRGHDVGPDES